MIEDQERAAFLARIGKNAKTIMAQTDPKLKSEVVEKQIITEDLMGIDEDITNDREFSGYSTEETLGQPNMNSIQKTETLQPKKEETYVDEDGYTKFKMSESDQIRDFENNSSIYGASDEELEDKLENSGLPDIVKEACKKTKIPVLDSGVLMSIQKGMSAEDIKKRFGGSILKETKDQPSVQKINETKTVNEVNKPKTLEPKPQERQQLQPNSIDILKEFRKILKEELSELGLSNGSIILNIDDDIKIAVGDAVYTAKLEYSGKRKKL